MLPSARPWRNEGRIAQRLRGPFANLQRVLQPDHLHSITIFIWSYHTMETVIRTRSFQPLFVALICFDNPYLDL